MNLSYCKHGEPYVPGTAGPFACDMCEREEEAQRCDVGECENPGGPTAFGWLCMSCLESAESAWNTRHLGELERASRCHSCRSMLSKDAMIAGKCQVCGHGG